MAHLISFRDLRGQYMPRRRKDWIDDACYLI